MKPHESLVLLPCHALSDFPYHHEGEAAADLLACYTSLWHPHLLAGAGRMPTWRSAYLEHEDLSGRLVLLPRVCGQDLPGHWADDARARGALLVEAQEMVSRETLVEQAAAALGRNLTPVPGGLTADFHALGLCHLLVELLTVQMRYSSLIDEELFSRHLIAAADAAVAGDEDTAREKLAICFDALHQSRSHFYPVECYLLDVTLVAPTTIGAALRHELGRGVPMSVLASGAVLEAMERNEAASLDTLREAISQELISLVGGEFDENLLPLLPLEQVLGNLKRGIATCQRLLGRTPRCFGRRRAGLTPVLPQLLENLNFAAAWHCTLDDGRFPSGRQSLTRWEGHGSIAIDALTRAPLDAALHETILAFPQHMSTAMDMDHVAIVAFAHWPGMTSLFYDDLRRSAAYGSVVGRFVTLEALFTEAEVSGQLTRFSADEYRHPFLTQLVAREEADPISQILARHVEEGTASAQRAVSTMTAVLRGNARNEAAGSLADFAAALPRGTDSANPGYLVVNPLSFSRQVVLLADQLENPPAANAPVTFAGKMDGRQEVIVEVPPLGYAWIAGDPTASWQTLTGKPLAEQGLLRNEFCEVTIHEKTGGIRTLHTPKFRGNRLSQQVALRRPGKRPETGEAWQSSDETAWYSTMVADLIEVSQSGPAVGEIVSRGRLLDDNELTVAEFQQRVRLVRGQPVVWIDVEIQPRTELDANPWQNYFCSRMALPGAMTDVYRSVGMCLERTEARRLEAPEMVEFRGPGVRTTLLAGGLPYHRRAGDSQLDTLLIVRGETQRQFRLGIGLDLSHPQTAALDALCPLLSDYQTAPPPRLPSAWLFHIDARNVVATHWEAVTTEDGRVSGVRVRLLETGGRAVSCGFYPHRTLTAARRLDFSGSALGELQVDGEKVIIDMAPGQWVQLEVEWP